MLHGDRYRRRNLNDDNTTVGIAADIYIVYSIICITILLLYTDAASAAGPSTGELDTSKTHYKHPHARHEGSNNNYNSDM